MADNVSITPGTGATIAADAIDGVLHQRVKVQFGDDGVASDVSSANPLPVDVSGVSSESTLLALKASIDALSAKITACNTGAVTVSNFPADQTVSATSLPLPSGAASEATQSSIKTATEAVVASLFASGGIYALGDKGFLALGKRRDADSAVVADGQLGTFNMDEEGRIKVASKPASYSATTGNVTTASSTVFVNCERFSNLMVHCKGTFAGVNCTFEGSLDSTNGTDGTWFTVQAIRSNANTIETTTGVLAAAPAYAWELSVNALKYFRVRATAWTSGTQVWTFVPGTYATEPIPGAQISGTQPVSGTVTATVTPPAPATPYFLNSAATTNGALIITGTSGLQAFYATNEGAAAAYVKLYNKATAPTVGTDVPEMIIPVPAAVSGVPGVASLPIGFSGFRFALGLGIAITGAAVYTDTTAVAAGQVKVKLSRTV